MTKAFTSVDSPLRISTVQAPKTGLIGMTICPGKQSTTSISGHGWARDLEQDIALIKSWGATSVVTLMEQWELETYQVPALGDHVKAADMQWFHLPIVDGGAPDSAWHANWITEGAKLRSQLKQDRKILIHCLGGRGRTGTVAAWLLIESGVPAETAIANVRTAREGAIETLVQEQWLRAQRT